MGHLAMQFLALSTVSIGRADSQSAVAPIGVRWLSGPPLIPWSNYASQCGVSASQMVGPSVCSYPVSVRSGREESALQFAYCCGTRGGMRTGNHPVGSNNGQYCCNDEDRLLCQHGLCPASTTTIPATPPPTLPPTPPPTVVCGFTNVFADCGEYCQWCNGGTSASA